MKSFNLLYYLLVIIGILPVAVFSQTQTTNKPPNIIYFLADDLGFGEIGVQGQKIIKTPNIDALAEQGMRFTQHYTGAPVCAPARCVLLTGKHMGHAYIRGNDAVKERGDVWNYAKASADPNLEGQRPLPANTVTLSKLLQQVGYTTGLFGKWGLGGPLTEGAPHLQGFDRFYGYNCQRQAHNLYPIHLWDDNKKVPLNNELIVPSTKLRKGADPNDPASYTQFEQKDYAPEMIHKEALKFIEDHHGEPFFMYYASPLPHVPLQIPGKYVEPYKKIIGKENPYTGQNGYFPNFYPRATYAAMISYLDEQLGDLINLLKEKGIYENTLIIFASDNGPTYTGGVDFNYFQSSQPFTNGYGKTKGFLYEGGIRIPMIVSWPKTVEPGTTSSHISAFYDVLPTLCEISGAKLPVHTDGLSFLPTLLGKNQKEHKFLYWEFPEYNGQQAVRMGKWKGIRKNMQEGNMGIELYNLEQDAKESNDLAGQYPKVVKKIEKIMLQEHQTSSNELFHIRGLDIPVQ